MLIEEGHINRNESIIFFKNEKEAEIGENTTIKEISNDQSKVQLWAKSTRFKHRGNNNCCELY